jgi:hypothetical protein
MTTHIIGETKVCVANGEAWTAKNRMYGGTGRFLFQIFEDKYFDENGIVMEDLLGLDERQAAARVLAKGP